MRCSEAERKVLPYIRGELDGDTLADFLKHVDSCPACREELEKWYNAHIDRKRGIYPCK